MKKEHELSNECLPILMRVYRSSQEHILEALKLYRSPDQKAEFLFSVNDTNMELLDSVSW